MKRALLELAVVTTCVLAGVGLGYGQVNEWHMSATVYLGLIFAVGAVALFLGVRIERRYDRPLNDVDRSGGAADVQDHGAHRDRHTA